ncbi:MAG: hypothetical protein ACP5QD_02485, partial [Candidatus Ratteibacteria bacterium]
MIKKQIVAVALILNIFVLTGFSQQEKSYTINEVIDKISARIQQLPDGQVIKNVSGSLSLSIKLNDTDYNNLKSAVEKVIGKSPSNPLKIEGNFVSVISLPGGKTEKFFFAGKSEVCSFYLYRNYDTVVCFLPELGIEMEDRMSEIRKVTGNDTPARDIMENLSVMMISNTLKTLFNQGKFWFYDAEISSTGLPDGKTLQILKKDDGKSIKMVVDTNLWIFKQVVFSDEKSTITMNFATQQDPKKIDLTDYMPQAITIDTT